MGRDGRGQNSVPDAQVATLVSQLEAAKAEIARLEADIVEFRSREARHLEVMLAQAQAMQRATERQRPLLLGQVTDQDATHSPSDPWYRRLWRRGRG